MLWPFSPLCRFETALVGFGKFQTPVDAGQELLADKQTGVPEQETPYLNAADWSVTTTFRSLSTHVNYRPRSGNTCPKFAI
jgi:hypothetical protein